jgi:alpha-glucosidase
MSAPIAYNYVNVAGFTPNAGGWSQIGPVTAANPSANTFVFTLTSSPQNAVTITVLGPTSYRLRFDPNPQSGLSATASAAVVNRNLGTVSATGSQSGSTYTISTGAMTIQVNTASFAVTVLRNGQVVDQDQPGQGLLWIPGQTVTAMMKVMPAGGQCVGFGEKAGSTVVKNNFTMTQFNFDNFTYNNDAIAATPANQIIPANNTGGPLNPSEPLYCSIPFMTLVNPTPSGTFAGSPYALGVFLDNPGQTYFNLGSNDYSDMTGKYYVGARYGVLDLYYLLADDAAGVLGLYTTLTGRANMPPKYVFGFHQGAYGYFDRYKLSVAANSYRAARIPLDGLHIDVDFQDNYRTFTHSEMKFPNCKDYFDDLHSIGFKMSTNITPLLTDNTLDEFGNVTPYTQRENILNVDGLLYQDFAGQPTSTDLYVGMVSYGDNYGTNPYPYPPLKPNNQGVTPLGAPGNYTNYAVPIAAQTWGKNYEHLICDLGLDMIWQDMTCPAYALTQETPVRTFPQDLLLAPIGSTTTVQTAPNALLHNAYAGLLLDATWTGICTLRPEKRNFIIARGGYAGIQRYAALWTGDSASSWDFLSINIPEVVNLGLSGVPMSGCDIGGFANGSGSSPYSIQGTDVKTVVGGITDYELLTRWMVLGSFLPWYRNHYNGYTKQYQEAYAYPEPVPSICRQWISLRYRMSQVWYDAMYTWTTTGLPPVRALFLTDGSDPQVYQHLNDEFFVGDDMLVAPIVTQGNQNDPMRTATRQVYLPATGDWWSFMDNQYPLPASVAGGTLITNWSANLNQVPIYIRAGGILPFRQTEQWIGQLPVNPITINCYPGPARSRQLYQDDGTTTQNQSANGGHYRLTTLAQSFTSTSRTLTVTRTYDNFKPSEPFYYVAFINGPGVGKPSTVTLNGTALPDVGNSDTLSQSATNAWYWNASINITFVKVFDAAAVATITVA